MIKVEEAIIVEGKYDKIKLSSIIDGLIITTNGFGIFNDKERRYLIRELAEKRGIIVMTDSDSAGFIIRNFLKGVIPKEKIKHAYIPDIFGKEKRKDKSSKEGKLGVEGVSKEIILEALRRCGAVCEDTGCKTAQNAGEITKTDFFVYGLTGGSNSSEKRKALKDRLNLPENMTTNSLLAILNCLMTRDEFINICVEINGDK